MDETEPLLLNKCNKQNIKYIYVNPYHIQSGKPNLANDNSY